MRLLTIAVMAATVLLAACGNDKTPIPNAPMSSTPIIQHTDAPLKGSIEDLKTPKPESQVEAEAPKVQQPESIQAPTKAPIIKGKTKSGSPGAAAAPKSPKGNQGAKKPRSGPKYICYGELVKIR